MSLRACQLGVAALLLLACDVPNIRADEDHWADFRFLMGSWVSEAKPEQGSGSFSLEPDLEGNVLVRRNSAQVPTGKQGEFAKHEDLMVIYPARGAKQFRASYFDSEGHVIHYGVSPLPGDKGLVFLSESAAAGPRFRLTYTKLAGDKVSTSFEIALPGHPEQFRMYLQGIVKRKETAQ